MILDFKEISQANIGGDGQDQFEQFACDFLETIGYNIVVRPHRGPDGKKDLIITETRRGINGKTTVKWMVSCKHYAFSKKTVSDTDEEDILDRVAKHKCNGFLGFYSTIPTSTLADKLYAFSDKIEQSIYDPSRIEKELLSLPHKDKERLFASYFPKSYDLYRQRVLQTSVEIDVSPKPKVSKDEIELAPRILTEDDILRISKTAIILLEIEKIKEEFYEKRWETGETPEATLSKLYRFTDHSNETVATAIFDFLDSVANMTRAGMPSKIASSIHSLVLTFFPSSYDKKFSERVANGKKCVYIGFSLVYDSFIYVNNFSIASYGLLILKFLYREGRRNQMQEVVDAVLLQYQEIDTTLSRATRIDLMRARELVQVFKSDLDTSDLRLPDMSEDLFNLIRKDREK